MKKQSCFLPGQTVVIREILDGKIWSAQPAIVVQDKPEMMALYVPLGTVAKIPCTFEGGRVNPGHKVASEWIMQDRNWDKHCLLRLTIPGSIYSVIIFWTPP
jgi:hypothetical protein